MLKKLTSLICSLVFLSLIGTTVYAQNEKIIYQDNVSTVYVSDSGAKTKNTIKPRYLPYINLKAEKISDFMGQEISTNFDDDIDQDSSFTAAHLTGTSNAYWMGNSPYNMDTIQITDTITGTGITGISAGSGWSIGIGSNSASITVSSNNVWKLSHTYEDITISGAKLSVKHSISTTFISGSSSKTINTSDWSSF